MGIFDHISCEIPLPDTRLADEETLQTKSLDCCMQSYTITEAGRLILHRRELNPARAYAKSEPPSIDIDQDYHGDIEMCGTAKGGGLAKYVVRFTHGSVEWILPFEELHK